MRRLAAIQYLRGAAALAVVAYHGLQWRAGGFDTGRAGVDVFFVISGVIMWRVTRGAESRPLPFLWRRLTRVAPLYWVLTLALTATALLWPAFLPNVHPAPGHVLLSLGFIPHFDPRGLPFPLLSLGWTLDYEAIFYLIVAAALLAPRRHQAAWIMGALATLVVAGFTLDDPLYILGANPMLLQFAAGVGLARLAEMGALPGRRGGVALIAAGLLAFALISGLHLFREIWRPFWWGAPAAAIVAGALAIDEAGATPRWPWALALGDASYALYLVHMPAQAVVKHTLGAANPWLFVPAALTASLAAGLACHLWIEKPLIAAARRAAVLARRALAIERLYQKKLVNRLDAADREA